MDAYYQMLIEFGRQWDAKRNAERSEDDCESDQSHDLRTHKGMPTGELQPEDWGQ